MSQFIVSTDLTAGSGVHIKRILSGREVRIASAFLGKGADQEVPASARLICDIGMGGTSPSALRALSEKLGDNLRYLRNFHAKVYLSDKGCVVGSANLSNNGVGFLSQAALMEAAILVDMQHPAAGSAAKWFDELWDMAHLVGDEAIEEAEAAWRRKKTGIPEGKRDYENLLEALKDQNGVAQKWGYIVTREYIPKDIREWASAQEAEISEEAGWKLTNGLDFFYNLDNLTEFEGKNSSGYYVSLHRGPKGRLYPLALRFVRHKDFPNSGGKDVVSFFEKLDWKATGMPKFSDKDLKKDSQLSARIANIKEKRCGVILSTKKFRNILSGG